MMTHVSITIYRNVPPCPTHEAMQGGDGAEKIIYPTSYGESIVNNFNLMRVYSAIWNIRTG
jgi:hypothetical protein